MSHIHQLPSYAMPDVSVPNRVQWEVQPDRAVLLIHDMQHYFLNKYDMQAEPIPSLIRHIQVIKAQCAKLGIPVIYTAQPTEQNPEDRALLTDFWGLGLSAPEHAGQEAIIDELAPSPDDIEQTKWRYSAFFRSTMREQMQTWGRDQLIVTGIYAHIGCMTTSLDAFMQGVQAFMVSDAVADFSEEEHRMALRYVSQRCGVVLNAQSLLSQLGAE